MIGRVAAAVLGVSVFVGLAACGGGGGGGLNPNPGPTPPGPTPPPGVAGQYAINGIDRIPQSMLKLSKTQMQGKWVLAETGSAGHARDVGRVACQSYVTDSAQCARADRTGKHRDSNGVVTSRAGGTTPFTELLDERFISGDTVDNSWLKQEAKSIGAKIVTYTRPGGYSVFTTDGGTLPYLVIHSAGNDHTNDSWYDIETPTGKAKIDAAIAAGKLLFVAGWDKDASGNYIRHTASSSCKATNNKLDNGCLWAQYEFPGIGNGTSYSAPQVSAALASVLAVFPDTTPENLAKFAKLSAKKTGNGIPALLAQSGGVGIADFASMDQTITALKNLPTGGNTDVVINGKMVNLSDRDLTLSFAQSQSARYFAGNGDDGERERLSFRVAPNGEDTVMAFATVRKGDFFASLGFGKYESFFGYRQGHGEVLGSEYAAGHENLFLHLADVRSSGGRLVSNAEGQSLGLTAEREFRPAEGLAVTLSANLEKFAGGEARIPVGKVELNEGEWSQRFGLSLEYAVDERTTLGLDSRLFLPGNGDAAVRAGLRLDRSF